MNAQDTYGILLGHGNPKRVIRYAKCIIKARAGKTPTEIVLGITLYELVEELENYLPEEVQKQFLGK